MTERTAHLIGVLGLVLVILTIPIYFLDLLVVSPAVDHCPARAGDNPDLVLWVFFAGIVVWLVGVALSIVAVTQRTSRAAGIGALIVAVVIPIGALMGAYLLLGGDCFVAATLVG